jgi:hypothetical protein
VILVDQAAEDRLPLDRADVSKIGDRPRDRGFDIRRGEVPDRREESLRPGRACEAHGRHRRQDRGQQPAHLPQRPATPPAEDHPPAFGPPSPRADTPPLRHHRATGPPNRCRPRPLPRTPVTLPRPLAFPGSGRDQPESTGVIRMARSSRKLWRPITDMRLSPGARMAAHEPPAYPPSPPPHRGQDHEILFGLTLGRC